MSNISFTDTGAGKTIVLLHGYLETKEVWSDFSRELSETNRVVCVDIPGHGNSSDFGEVHNMEAVAERLHNFFVSIEVRDFILVGHSMGGYVALAYASMYEDNLSGLVLFHSSVYSDNDEKKANRQREINLIKDGKKELILKTNLPRMFADENVEKFKGVLDDISDRAKNHSQAGVCALLRGMMERNDQQDMIRNFPKSLMFIFGKKDNYIPVSAGDEMCKLNNNIQPLWLGNSGHMGFVEEMEKAKEALLGFVN